MPYKLVSMMAWACLLLVAWATLSPAFLRPKLMATEPAWIVLIEHVGAFAESESRVRSFNGNQGREEAGIREAGVFRKHVKSGGVNHKVAAGVRSGGQCALGGVIITPPGPAGRVIGGRSDIGNKCRSSFIKI